MKKNMIFSATACLLLCILNITSCGVKEEVGQDSRTIEIDLKQYKDFVSDCTLVKDFCYIPLSNQHPIGHVDKLLLRGGSTFILDRKVSQKIHCYDSQGNFRYSIDALGKGPGEYLRPYDIDIDEQGNLHLMDLIQNKILKYNQEGLFQGEYRYGFKAKSFAQVADNKYVFYNNRRDNRPDYQYQIIYWDAFNDTFTKKWSFSEETMTQTFLVPSFGIWRSGNNLLHSPSFSDVIYSIQEFGSELDSVLSFDFGKYSSSSLSLDSKKYYSNIEKFPELFDRELFRQIDNAFENASHIICNLSIANETFLFVYCKKTGHYGLKSSRSIYQTDGMMAGAIPYGVENDQFISIMSTSYLTSYLESWEEEGADSSVLADRKISFLLDEGYRDVANPVLIKYTLNDF